jgi:putative tryptophan/tyrosine transport system substrate-binding protein
VGRRYINRSRALARELVSLQPDIIVTAATPPTVAVQRETRTIPIVFVGVSDPVLSEIAPGLKRAAIMFNPDTAPVSTYMPSFETAARSLKVQPITAPRFAATQKSKRQSSPLGASPEAALSSCRVD